MPALQMFGRRWALAADDVPVLAFPAALFHLIWFIFLVVAFSAISKPSSCSNTASYEACIIGLFICFFLSACLESWLAVEGMRGTCVRSFGIARLRAHRPCLLQAVFLSQKSAPEWSHYCMHRLQSLCLKCHSSVSVLTACNSSSVPDRATYSAMRPPPCLLVHLMHCSSWQQQRRVWSSSHTSMLLCLDHQQAFAETLLCIMQSLARS